MRLYPPEPSHGSPFLLTEGAFSSRSESFVPQLPGRRRGDALDLDAERPCVDRRGPSANGGPRVVTCGAHRITAEHGLNFLSGVFRV